jgi:hypothetical protein
MRTLFLLPMIPFHSASSFIVSLLCRSLTYSIHNRLKVNWLIVCNPTRQPHQFAQTSMNSTNHVKKNLFRSAKVEKINLTEGQNWNLDQITHAQKTIRLPFSCTYAKRKNWEYYNIVLIVLGFWASSGTSSIKCCYTPCNEYTLRMPSSYRLLFYLPDAGGHTFLNRLRLFQYFSCSLSLDFQVSFHIIRMYRKQ